MRTWQAIGGFSWKGEGAFWSWLSVIARTVVQKEARRLRAQKRAARGQVSLQQPVRTSDGSLGELVDLVRRSATSPSRAMQRDE